MRLWESPAIGAFDSGRWASVTAKDSPSRGLAGRLSTRCNFASPSIQRCVTPETWHPSGLLAKALAVQYKTRIKCWLTVGEVGAPGVENEAGLFKPCCCMSLFMRKVSKPRVTSSCHFKGSCVTLPTLNCSAFKS